MPARLLMLVERFPPDLGGLARSGGRVAAALARLDVEVDVLAWTRACPPGALESSDRGGGVTLHRLGLHGALDHSLQHTLNVLEWLHAEEHYEALWGHYLHPAGFTATLFGARAGVPVTVSARGNDVDRLVFPPGDFARLLWTLERAQVVSAASADLALKIDRLVGRDLGVEVLGNAVDADLFAPGPAPAGLREELGIASDEAVLCFCGELREKKGLPFLLEALTRVRRERPACLLVIGEVRAREEARLAGFAADFPEDAARVLVTGRLDDPAEVAAHLRLADLFLQPSLWDGLPNAVLEAMACERVVLASDAGGIPEAIEDRVSGFLVPRPHLHRLGEAALELLELPAARRAEVGAAARLRVAERFSPAAEAAALGRVLARLDGG